MMDCPSLDETCKSCLSGESRCDSGHKNYTKLLVGVGIGNLGYTNNIEIIDLGSSSTSCQDLANFPRSIEGPIGGLKFNRNPIICGGYLETFEQSEISECYTYEDGFWSSSPSLTSPRAWAAATPSPFPKEAHSLFVTGGYHYPEGDMNTMEALSGGGWQELLPRLPVEIVDHCMVLVNSTTVMIIGGFQNGEYNYSPNTFYFNTENEKWVEGPRLLSSRISHSCGMLQKDRGSSEKSVIVAGGNNETHPFLSTVEILDFGESEWRTGPSLPSALTGASMVQVPSGGVLLIGGQNEILLNTIYQLSDVNSEWVLMPQKLKVGRSYATAFLVPNEITNCN